MRATSRAKQTTEEDTLYKTVDAGFSMAAWRGSWFTETYRTKGGEIANDKEGRPRN
jgi:hypothetical protein